MSRSSLAVREFPDGRVLVHDFGGCAVGEILQSIGLEIGAMFPERIDTSPEARGDRRYQSRQSQSFPAADVLRCIADDVLLAATITRSVVDAGGASDVEVRRLFDLAGRLARAAEAR